MYLDATIGTAERVCRQVGADIAHAENLVSGSVTTHVFWATPISRPLMASFYTQNLGNIWVLLSFPELPWVFCLLWDGPATGLLEICGTGPSWLER